LAVEDEEFEDLIPIYGAAAIPNYPNDKVDDPKSHRLATESMLTETWDTARKEELNGIGRHPVFRDFMELPKGRMALPSHWVYMIECDGTGNMQQFKAGLVCVGNHLIEDINYQATNALTAHLANVRLAFLITTKYDLEIHQMDVWAALMGVDLEEGIYIHPPQG